MRYSIAVDRRNRVRWLWSAVTLVLVQEAAPDRTERAVVVRDGQSGREVRLPARDRRAADDLARSLQAELDGLDPADHDRWFEGLAARDA